MINKLELKACFVRKGLTQAQVANYLDISSKTFARKVEANTLTTKEVSKLIELLSIKDPTAVFFANNLTC